MKDQISALIDDELDLEDAEHLLTAIKSGGALGECWATYHLIGDVMRGNPVLSSDLKQRVMSQLAEEPVVLAPQAATNKALATKRTLPIIWSVAASVAAVLFVGLVVQQQVQPANDALAPVEIAQNMPNEYLLAHQASSPNSVAYYIQPAAYSESRR